MSSSFKARQSSRLLGQSSRLFLMVAACALLLALGGASTTYAQGCPTLFSPNRGWAQSAIARYAFTGNFTEEQKRQIRAAAAEWSRANSINNSKVSFVEDTTGQNFNLEFKAGALTPGNPAAFNATYNGATLTIISATITYDPNNTFPGSNTLVADPGRPGYDTVVMKLVMHEIGHLMGLDHPVVPANICDQPDGATTLNYACNINDQGNNIPTTIPLCDQNAINSESIYPPISLPPPSIQVESSSVAVSVDEGAGRAQVIVTRTGDHTLAVSADYATSDSSGLNACSNATGLASSRCDYATSIGTLRFAAGETSKTIFIPLVNDIYAEGNETFRLTLNNPSGASLGTSTSATITVTDNETVTGTGNPIDSVAFFVRQHYIDFLGREPDPVGYQGWQNILNNCPSSGKDSNGNYCDRIEVSSGFFRSEEFQTRGYFIYRFYSAVGKIPLYEGFMPDLAKVSGFLSAQQVEANKVAFVNEFMARPDFQNRYGSLTDPTAYVNALLQTVGLPNHQNRDFWIAELTAQRMTRGQVLRALVESGEVYQKYYNEAFVIMQYFGYLRRSADISYLQWINTINGTGDYRVMINGFLNSAEYRQRFGP
jgi:hypothetical protein